MPKSPTNSPGSAASGASFTGSGCIPFRQPEQKPPRSRRGTQAPHLRGQRLRAQMGVIPSHFRFWVYSVPASGEIHPDRRRGLPHIATEDCSLGMRTVFLLLVEWRAPHAHRDGTRSRWSHLDDAGDLAIGELWVDAEGCPVAVAGVPEGKTAPSPSVTFQPSYPATLTCDGLCHSASQDNSPRHSPTLRVIVGL